MSRSYREPWYTQGYGSRSRKRSKRYANRVVRRTTDVPNGKAYKKYWDPWNICDWKWMYNPYPHYWSWDGEIRVIEPGPIWRVNRK